MEGLSLSELRMMLEEDLKYLESRKKYGYGPNYAEVSKDERNIIFVASHQYPVNYVYMNGASFFDNYHNLYEQNPMSICRGIKSTVRRLKHPARHSDPFIDLLRYRYTEDGVNFRLIGPKVALDKAIECEMKRVENGKRLLTHRSIISNSNIKVCS